MSDDWSLSVGKYGRCDGELSKGASTATSKNPLVRTATTSALQLINGHGPSRC